MPTSSDTRGMAEVLVSPAGQLRGARRRVLDVILEAMGDDEGLVVPDYQHGYCGGWDVRIHPADAKTKRSEGDMYLVSDRGLYVGFLEKKGLMSAAPAHRFFSHGAISSCGLETMSSPDGSETHALTLRGVDGRDLVSLVFIYVAGFGFDNHAPVNVARLQEALRFRG